MTVDSDFSKFYDEAEIMQVCKDVVFPLILDQINYLKYKDLKSESQRVFLYGIGQGADLANTCFLMWKGERLGGIIATVGILPLSNATIAKIAPVNDLAVIPILILNGNDDPHVNAKLAKKTYSYY